MRLPEKKAAASSVVIATYGAKPFTQAPIEIKSGPPYGLSGQHQTSITAKAQRVATWISQQVRHDARALRQRNGRCAATCPTLVRRDFGGMRVS